MEGDLNALFADSALENGNLTTVDGSEAAHILHL